MKQTRLATLVATVTVLAIPWNTSAQQQIPDNEAGLINPPTARENGPPLIVATEGYRIMRGTLIRENDLRGLIAFKISAPASCSNGEVELEVPPVLAVINNGQPEVIRVDVDLALYNQAVREKDPEVFKRTTEEIIARIDAKKAELGANMELTAKNIIDLGGTTILALNGPTIALDFSTIQKFSPSSNRLPTIAKLE